MSSAPCPSTEEKVEEAYTPTCVLATGCAGFIGSNVIVYLTEKYPKVKWVCLDKVNYCGSIQNVKEVMNAPNFTFVKGDITSVDLVNHILHTEKVDTIMHFAAETHVDNSFGNSFAFTRTNIIGTHCLLECARLAKHKIRRFLHVSTDEVYGEARKDQMRMDESTELNPTNPYSATKAAAEFLVRSYAHSYNIPIVITRGNNVYGPKQYPEKLIPKFISLLSRNQPCPLHGDGKNQRSFLYVDDVARAFDVILHKGKNGAIYNIGSHYEFTNVDVCKMLLKIFNFKDEAKYITFVKDRAFNDFRYHIDTAELESLGWKQEIDFPTGLTLTKEWYIANPDNWGDITEALAAHPTHFKK